MTRDEAETVDLSLYEIYPELNSSAVRSDEGLSNADLANRLVISEATVKGHVGNVLRKLGVEQRSAIAWVLGSR